MRIKNYIITNAATAVPKECFEPFDEMRKCTSLEAAEKAAFFVARLKDDVKVPKNRRRAVAFIDALRNHKAVSELDVTLVDGHGNVSTGVYNFYDVLRLLQDLLGKPIDVNEYFEFASEYIVTFEDIQRLVEIDRLKKELDEEYSSIKAHIMQDAELFKDGSMFSTYELESVDGIITVTDKHTLEVLRPGALISTLNDTHNDIVQMQSVYKIDTAHSKLFIDIYKDNIGDSTTEEFFEALYNDYGSKYCKGAVDSEAFATQIRKQLKKEYSKNILVFRKLFDGVSLKECMQMAEDYYMACNRDKFLKLLVLAKIDPADKEAVQSFITKVKATYLVTDSTTFTLRVKS